MIKYWKSYTKVTARVKEGGSDLSSRLPTTTAATLTFQMIVVVGVALSCFKVKVPFIVAIKQSSRGRTKEPECQGRVKEEIRRDKGRKKS